MRLALLLAVPALSAPAHAATLKVCGGCMHTTLASALDVARAGDVIEVAAGRFGGAVDVPTAVTIRGAGRGKTVLTGAGPVLTLSADAALEDLDVTPTSGSAVLVDAADVQLRRVAIYGARVSGLSGGGLRIEGRSDVLITGSAFSDNEVLEGYGGHIYSTNARLSVTSTTFDGGQAERGGSIASEDSYVTVEDSSFTDGKAVYGVAAPYGGHLYMADSTLTVDGSTLDGGEVDNGYGGNIAAVSGSEVELTDTIVRNGVSLYYGAGVYVYTGSVVLRRGELRANRGIHATYGNGAGMYAHTAEVDIVDTLFAKNDASAYGGGLYVIYPVEVSLVGASFEDNRSRLYGGGLYLYTRVDVALEELSVLRNSGYLGAGMWIQNPWRDATISVARTELVGNRAGSGGGGLYAYTAARVELEDVDVVDNEAVAGGGLMFYATDEVEIDRAWVVGNRASYGGGAYLGALGSFSIRWSTVASNQATSNYGGGLYVSLAGGGSTLDAQHVAFVENEARVAGGAARIDVNGAARFEQCVFAGNDSALGSAVYALRGLDRIRNSIFVDQVRGAPIAGEVSEAAYNVDWHNAASLSGTQVVRADPRLRAWTLDGDVTNDDFHTSCDSPAIDAGHPGVKDPDISRSDIGLYGGPDAPATLFRDVDRDGYEGICDCDDLDASVHPDAYEEPYDGIDNDCRGGDECDLDEDGFDSVACEGGDDCDDAEARTFPGAEDRWYDGRDSNCDGKDDFDQDGDGSRSGDHGGDDCDDLDPRRYPGAPEPDCDDPVDWNCDGSTGSDDRDGDGVRACDDCDDADPLAYPGNVEIPYDGIDNNCLDGDLTDVDGDGFDSVEVGGLDCLDLDPSVNPDREEIPYDGRDNDCADGDLVDVDGDGFDARWVGGDDCDDTDPAIRPGATEIEDDGVDQDCDGLDIAGVRVEGAGCGCSTADPSASWIPALAALLVVLRRRTR